MVLSLLVWTPLAVAASNGKHNNKVRAQLHGPAITINTGHIRSLNDERSRTNPSTSIGWSTTGKASWYGRWHAGKPTSSGEKFDPKKLTAAHRTLPLGTIISVTNEENGKEIIVKVNDRGPYYRQRILDLSEQAAKDLGFHDEGEANVKIKVLKLPPPQNEV
jgi:rare lipoprotein A (peptidoglycan hydrolase)